MINIKDKTSSSTIHIANTGGFDYVPVVVYELELGNINSKIEKLEKLVTKEYIQEELDKIKK